MVVLSAAALVGAVSAPARAQDAGGGGQATDRPPAEVYGSTPTNAGRETECANGLDDDGDGLADCADADCFRAPHCESHSGQENTNATCSDFIDNDGDDAVDCDDADCNRPGITVCQGSADRRGGGRGAGRGGPRGLMAVDDDLPELPAGATVDDLIGNYGDIDGERSDELCSDGFDNDSDGRVDCADFGCRFDPSVTVCNGSPDIRFSAVVGVGGGWQRNSVSDDALAAGVPQPRDIYTTAFERIQLRALGPIPFIQDSFFLINVRAERTPRLTFAMFQVPLGGGHYFNLNSGSGSLSTALIISAAKQLLLDPAFYVYNAFEQGNGAAIEVGGPIVQSGLLKYRVFLAGGSGEFTGNVGGRFFRSDDRNFTYTAGAQLGVNIVGRFDRFDTPFLYTPVPLTVALLAGGKWDQRAVERFVAWNTFFITRWNRFILTAEHYGKREFELDSVQASWNVQFGALIIPKWFFLAADVGGFYAGDPNTPPGGFSAATVRRPLDEFQWRIAAHLYWYRTIGLASIVYSDRTIQANPDRIDANVREQQLRAEVQFRF
jgi:hypothetical protein